MKGMGTKLTLGILVIIIIAAAGIYLQYGYLGEPITEPQVKDIIKDKYPNADDGNIMTTYEENCTICDSAGCYELDDCWTAEFAEGGIIHSVMGGSGQDGGGVIVEEDNPCTEWWCDAVDCVYFYKEIIPNGSKSYYNTGCSNPTPVCDEGYEKCKACDSPNECIRKTITDLPTINETVYHYDIIDANSWGEINITEYMCMIYDDGGEVFYNQSTVEQCETIMLLWSKCGNGICDFEPVYGMIPP